MKQIVIILLIVLSNLSVKAKDSTSIKGDKINKITTQVDTVKFVNDTAYIADEPKISHIVYADNSSSLNIIGKYLFPIIMLLLGVGIDRLIVWLTEKKRIKKIGKRWIAELRGVLEPIKKQQSSLMLFIAEYCDKPEQSEIPNIAVFSAVNGSKFNSLGKEDLYEYLERFKGIEHEVVYQKICDIISSLEITNKQFIEEVKEFRSKGSKLIGEYNSYVQQYRTFLFNVVLFSREDTDEIIRIFNEVSKEGGRHCNVYKSIDEFINPSIEILKKYNTNEIAIKMRNVLFSCLDCVLAMKNEKVYIKMNFERACNLYEKIIEATNGVLKLFDNKK